MYVFRSGCRQCSRRRSDPPFNRSFDVTKAIPFLRGERAYLRALVESDLEGPYLTWFNDEEVCRGNSHYVFPYTAEAALTYIRHAGQSRENLILAIVRREDDNHIGNIALQSIHPVYRSADLSIVIGDKSAWRKGYAREAMRLLCEHGFGALNLNRIACGTFEDNEAMKRLALAVGMREEGRRRQAAFKQGRYLDIIEYGVLKSDYERSTAASQ
jgi:ribosomal-protein-alanine N-acetyltransferase